MADSTNYPNLHPSNDSAQNQRQSAGQTMQNAKDAVANSKHTSAFTQRLSLSSTNFQLDASSAINAIANHPVTKTVTDGPVAESARDQVNKTSNEFSNVANSRRVPDHKAATGQELTHYHSMFYNILSWENPRVTSIVYASIVAFFFFTRYVPVLSMFLKGTYIALGIIAASEIAGKLIFNQGLATQMRPRKYFTLPRASLERSLEDAEQFINFFVIEAQRIVFAENIYATIATFAAALSLYVLRKFTPAWGMGLIATSVVFFVPLIYTTNKELIDTQMANAQHVINAQATQVRDIAAQQTARASEVAKSTANQYTAKAQEMMGQAKSTANQYSAKAQETMGQAKSKAASANTSNPGNTNDEPLRDIKNEFPSTPTTVPQTKPLSETIPQALREDREPLLAL